MGGGLLGLEAARALQGHGLHVELVHAMPYLMNMQLDAEAGAILKKSVESLGIAVHLDVFATDVIGTDRVRGVGLADGRQIEADLLVVAAGVRPSTDIAVRSGLEVERGIVVDDQLRTDDPDIYAIGECAQHRGEVYGLVAPAWEHAEGAGRRPHRHRPDRRVPRQPDGDEAQGRRRRRRRHGDQHPGAGRRRVPGDLRAASAACTCRWSSATTS